MKVKLKDGSTISVIEGATFDTWYGQVFWNPKDEILAMRGNDMMNFTSCEGMHFAMKHWIIV